MSSALFVLFFTVSGAAIDQPPPDMWRTTFLERVDRYVALHRQLEGPLPPEIVTADTVALLAPRRALAEAIREARRDARQGDVFTPATAQYFRRLIAEALLRDRIGNVLAMVHDEEEDIVAIMPSVNGDYPGGAPVSFMAPCILAALPPLPPELEYRFLGRDLILWDVHAGLIVDFMPRALPETT